MACTLAPEKSFELRRVFRRLTGLKRIVIQLRVNCKQLVAEVMSYGEHLLEEYLRESGWNLHDVYRKTGDSWTSLIRQG